MSARMTGWVRLSARVRIRVRARVRVSVSAKVRIRVSARVRVSVKYTILWIISNTKYIYNIECRLPARCRLG